MPNYRQITIPNLETIQSSVLAAIPSEMMSPAITFLNRLDDKTIYNTVKSIPELDSYLTSVGVKDHLVDMALYIMDSSYEFDIHMDVAVPGYNTTRIICPIQGAANTFTEFYSTDTPPSIEYVNVAGVMNEFSRYDKANCTLIDSVDSGTPYLMNTQTIHGMRNPNNEWRIVLWIDFNDQVNLWDQITG